MMNHELRIRFLDLLTNKQIYFTLQIYKKHLSITDIYNVNARKGILLLFSYLTGFIYLIYFLYICSDIAS